MHIKIMDRLRCINKIHGNTWKYMEIHGNTWKYMEIHGKDTR
jgi:hypothetical protein